MECEMGADSEELGNLIYSILGDDFRSAYFLSVWTEEGRIKKEENLILELPF